MFTFDVRHSIGQSVTGIAYALYLKNLAFDRKFDKIQNICTAFLQYI